MTTDPTVFIVDDDAAVRDAASNLLHRQGFKTKAYASAEAFLDQFHPSQTGCLLLDLQMPGMNGLELKQELQRRNIPIPIIFCTGNADRLTGLDNLSNDAANFIEKPFEPSVLISAIRQAFQ